MNCNFIKNIFKLNWRATLCLNYKAAGLQAIFRMPIKVYGKLRWHISGNIILPNDAIRNTLIIGSSHEDYTVSSGRAELNILGTWRIGGIVRIGHDSFIGIKENAVLKMGDGCMIARDTQIHCSNNIVFGKDVFCGEVYVTDSTEHEIIHHGESQPMASEVVVGDGTYLGFRCMLLKGCRIPPRSVVASGAICTKDYTKEGKEKLFIAGIPAAVKDTNTTAIK